MHDQRSYPCPSKGTPAWQDWTFQRAVLVSLINLHPVQLTITELIREIAVNPEDFGTRDGIERATLDLEGMGLLHRHDFLNREDSIVVPTRPALHFFALLEDDWTEDEDELAADAPQLRR
jgi:hypothetical protein